MTLEFSRPLGRTVEVSAFVFGYRHDRPFSSKPKVRIRIGELLSSVQDQATRLRNSGILAVRRARTVTVQIPLGTLDNPERILTAASTHFGFVPLDRVAWRAVAVSCVPAASENQPITAE